MLPRRNPVVYPCSRSLRHGKHSVWVGEDIKYLANRNILISDALDFLSPEALHQTLISAQFLDQLENIIVASRELGDGTL